MSTENKSKYYFVAIFFLCVGLVVVMNLRSTDEDKIDASVKRCLSAVMARDAARLVEEIHPTYYFVNKDVFQDSLIKNERSSYKFDNKYFTGKTKAEIYYLALAAFAQCESIDIRLLNSQVTLQDNTAEAFPIVRATVRIKPQSSEDSVRVREQSPDVPPTEPVIHKMRLKYQKEGERWLITEIEELRDEPVSME